MINNNNTFLIECPWCKKINNIYLYEYKVNSFEKKILGDSISVDINIERECVECKKKIKKKV